MSVLEFFSGKPIMEIDKDRPVLSSIKKKTEISKQNNYKCNSCNTIFNTKNGFIEHNEKFCYLLFNTKNSKTTIEIKTEIEPDIKELFNVIKILSDKVFNLEKELSLLKINGNVKKKDILEWLNEKIKPEKTYLEWINSIQIKRKYLKIVLETSLSQAIIQLFTDYKSKYIIPLRFFVNKQKIYIYSQNNSQEFPKWNDNMKEEEFNKFIDIICDKFLKEFILWTNENKDLIKIHQQLEEDYISYTNKIFRTKTMNLHIYSVIKKFLTCKIGEL